MTGGKENRSSLLTSVTLTLKEGGFNTTVVQSRSSSREYCFDILAKKKSHVLLVKPVQDLDRVPMSSIHELRAIAYATRSVPLLVALRNKGKPLEDNVVYKKFRVYSVNLETFEAIIKCGEKPLIYTERGGYYVKINGQKLREARERKNLSLGELAEKAGVTRKTIYDYEREKIESTPDVAAKLQEVLGENIIKPLNIFEWYKEESRWLSSKSLIKQTRYVRLVKSKMLSHVLLELRKRGMLPLFFRRAPFEALAFSLSGKTRVIFKTVVKCSPSEFEEAQYSATFAKMTSSFLVIVASDTVKDQVEEISDLPNTVVLTEKDISKEKISDIPRACDQI